MIKTNKSSYIALLVSRFLLCLSVIYALGVFLAPHQARAFLAEVRWVGNSTEWRTVFVFNTVRGPFPVNAYSLVQSAAAQWSQPNTGKNFNFINFTNQTGPTRVYITETNFNTAGLGSTNGTTLRSFSGSNISGATVYFNNRWSWNNTCIYDQNTKKADFITVALHEFGHTVALGHDVNNQGAVMWPAQVCRQGLTADDKNGVGALYGP